MRSRLIRATLLASSVAGPLAPASAQTIGSPLTSRPNVDNSTGLVLIYRGTTAPFPFAGLASTWGYFDASHQGQPVTPLLFEITNTNEYTLRAIGTTRNSAGTGAQSFPFETILGNPTILAGRFTFGVVQRLVTAPGGTIQLGAVSAVVPFTAGPTSDAWSYATPGTILIGQVYGGASGVLLDPLGTGGRIYSAQMSQGTCYANCDGSTASPVLSAGDFVCFLARFRAGDSAANCDGSTGSPALTAADFVCFLASFRAGCP